MYHVGVSNIFELLDDENDEQGGKRVVPRVAVNQETAAPTKGTKATGQPQAKKTDPFAKKDYNAGKGDQNKGDRRPRQEGGERRPRQEGERAPRQYDGERRPRQEGGERRPRQEGDRPPRQYDGERRPRPEGERRPREDRPPREPREPRQPRDDAPFDRTNERKPREQRAQQYAVGEDGAPIKRVYDRRSGTGRGREGKRQGGGAGNWGKDNGDGKWDQKPVAEDLAKIEGESEEPASPAVSQETEEQKAIREEAEKKKKEEEEREAKLMTLDDYEKKRAEGMSKYGIQLPTARQAGEGVDKKEAQKWATYTVVAKKGEDEEEDRQTDSKKKDKKEAKKQPVSADLLNFQAKKPERRDNRDSRGDRENRNSPKPNPKEGKNNAPKKRSGPAPDVKDSSNFPALSTKA